MDETYGSGTEYLGGLDGLLGGGYNSALNFAANQYDFERTPDTAPTNALQSMQPITGSTSNSGADNNWSGFWQDTLKGLVSTGTKALTTQTAVAANTQQLAAAQQAAVTTQRLQQRQLLLFAGVGLAVYLVAKG